MLFKEKEVPKKEKNPYGWPTSYYMEMDAVQRKMLLEEQLSQDPGEEMQKIKKLFDCRYSQTKDGKYMDLFLKAWMELAIIGPNLNSFFAQKKNKKEAEKAAEVLCLKREEEFGTDLLYDELKHLAGVYIVSCQSDSHYQSILFSMGRMKEDKVKQKIKNDLQLISRTVPEAVGMKDTFSLFEKAVWDMGDRLL